MPSFVANYLNPDNEKYFNKLVYLVSIIYLVLIFITNKLIDFKEENSLNRYLEFFDKFRRSYYYALLFLFTIISQNLYLNFETITWDVPSYLVATLPIDEGYLPYEIQWETKGPLLIYIYYFLNLLSQNSYVLFKILNDIVLFLISIVLFKTTILYKERKSYALISALLFLLLFSDPVYTAEYSELYSLLFISISFYIYVKNDNKKQLNNYEFAVGALISIASLVNQVSAIFFLPFLVDMKLKNKLSKTILKKFFIGLLIPQIIFQLLYFFNDSYYIFLMNYFYLPFGYQNYYQVNILLELKVWFKEYFYFNKAMYFSLITVFIFEVLNLKKIKPIVVEKSILYLTLLTSLTIYFIGNTGYGHHLFYFIYFSTLLISNIKKTHLFIILFSFVTFSAISVFINSFEISKYNLFNYKELQDEYPLYQLSKEISNFIDEDSKILALDSVLLLYYLDKPNYSYIIHPTNHYFQFITEPLISLKKIQNDEVNFLVNLKPDVIICSSMRVGQGGSPIQNNDFNCNYDLFSIEYFELDTKAFLENRNIAYYYDPYHDLKVFIKKTR